MDTRLVPQDIYLKHEEEWRVIRAPAEDGKGANSTSGAWNAVKARRETAPSADQARSLQN